VARLPLAGEAAPDPEQSAPSALVPSTRLLLVLEHGQVVSSQPVPENACVIDPNSQTAMATLFREYVPGELLADIMTICVSRLAYMAGKAQARQAA
jgi:hypothetical protein